MGWKNPPRIKISARVPQLMAILWISARKTGYFVASKSVLGPQKAQKRTPWDPKGVYMCSTLAHIGMRWDGMDLGGWLGSGTQFPPKMTQMGSNWPRENPENPRMFFVDMA